MAKKKNEAVTASFHYLTRTALVNDMPVEQAITMSEYETFYDRLVRKPKLDMSNERHADRVRMRSDVPLENIERPEPRIISGTFRASYWGHEYDNTARGRIPADSISLRPFHFVLYLAEAGRIYVGSQYLGQFGGYGGLRRTLCDALPNSDNVRSHSYRLGAVHYRDAKPKEVRVNVRDKGASITSANTFGASMKIAFTKSGKDDPMPERVRNRLLPFLGSEPSDIRRVVANLINESELIEVNDDDIVDCTVLADFKGKQRVIHMFEDGNFATRFPLEVEVQPSGHPEMKKTHAAMLQILRDEILARS